MPVIAAKAPPLYEAPVAAAIVRLLALFALILMPIGMGLSPAAAATTTAKVMDEHCGGTQKPDDHGTAGPAMHCSACTALPVEVYSGSIAILYDDAARAMPAVQRLLGTELEIATPPPKRA